MSLVAHGRMRDIRFDFLELLFRRSFPLMGTHFHVHVQDKTR